MLYGNWSDPVLVFKMTATGNGTDQTSVSTSSGLDAWVYAVLVLAFITLVVSLVLLIICVYKYFCFHRRIKYVRNLTSPSSTCALYMMYTSASFVHLILARPLYLTLFLTLFLVHTCTHPTGE